MAAGPRQRRSRLTAREFAPLTGKVWEVDVFAGRADGLVLAEIELNAPGEQFDLPDWVGKEVTDDPCFRNSAIALIPVAGVAA
ncbi:hypothetical protein [Sphingobium sp. EM0848]|uniref:hypothetical protein n=1 Tax=Sphingobium sp. EM0848 TaxID=2743473 RepID=UPI00159CA999|nr:hypothetical protein [Sphingobium sp. EM0848]